VWLGIQCAEAIVWIAHHVNDSFLSLQVISPRGLLALSVVVFLFTRLRKQRHALAIAVVVSMFTLVIVTMPALEIFPQESWDVVACDVGQGDASVIRTSQHSALVIDSGADAELMNACLENLEIESVDLFIPSHFHADHVGGIEGMSRNREVKAVLVPQCHEPAAGFSLVSAMLPRTSIAFATVGQSRRLSSRVTYQVLAVSPCTADASEGAMINNSSVVVLVTIAGGSILFTGDIEEQAQQELQSHYPSLKTNLIKIPHHGSRYQSDTFAHQFQPVFAWASVGENNQYGHPASSTISMYREVGAQVVTTMECGAISMRFAETFTWRGSRSCHA
jgi:competence protein ComEC